MACPVEFFKFLLHREDDTLLLLMMRHCCCVVQGKWSVPSFSWRRRQQTCQNLLLRYNNLQWNEHHNIIIISSLTREAELYCLSRDDVTSASNSIGIVYSPECKFFLFSLCLDLFLEWKRNSCSLLNYIVVGWMATDTHLQIMASLQWQMRRVWNERKDGTVTKLL